LSGKYIQTMHTPTNRYPKLLLNFASSILLFISFFTYHVVISCPTFSVMLLAWAINTAATASYKAVPSMFTVAPSGSTKRLIRASTLLCSSRQRIVVGRVAELRKIKMALKYFKITPQFFF